MKSIEYETWWYENKMSYVIVFYKTFVDFLIFRPVIDIFKC